MSPSLEEMVPRWRSVERAPHGAPRIAATRFAPDRFRRADVVAGHAFGLPVVRELRPPAAGHLSDRTW
jgi:hypothetical protein